MIKEYIKSKEAEFEEKFPSVFGGGISPDDISDKLKFFLTSSIHGAYELALDEINPIEIAERIVIEYANISGRESDNRAYVREAATKVLSDLLKKERGGVTKEV